MSDIPTNLENLNGIFTYCIYKSFNYGVYRFRDNSEGDIVVTGEIKDVEIGEEYKLYGNYTEHPRYGFQFNVVHIEKELPSTYDGIVTYLSSDLFKGIGKKKAEKIVKYLGEDALIRIKEDPTILAEIGIKEKDINTIKEVLSSNLDYEESFYYLLGLNISMKDLQKIIKAYKENTRAILEENPFRPFYEIYGIGYKKCEEIALKLDFEMHGEKRYVALIYYLVGELCFRSGNTYLSYLEIETAFRKYLNDGEVDFGQYLEIAIDEKKIYCVEERYYQAPLYLAEEHIANFMCENNYSIDYDLTLVDEKIEYLENESQITYDIKQKEAIYNFFRHKLSFVVGGPGTGKTTIIKALVNSLRELHPTYELHVVAPTGRAAKRISELCGVNSSTIHSLLKWDKETNTFSYSIENPLLLDVLIIDEFSMVDTWLFDKLTSALANVKKICIIGDDNQLPSVGPGNLLNEFIASNTFEVTRLNTIFRQGEQSDIIKLSNDILNNSVDFNTYLNDVFIDGGDELILKESLVNMMHNYLSYGYTINDLQVLAPMYKGGMGIDALNALLQEVFNPKTRLKSEFKTKYKTFREGDKILQLKNQNSDDVFNGDIGEIIEITNDKDSVNIIAKYGDILVEYGNDDINNIALAYCISVHKAQGGEYPIVFFAVSRAHTIMLNKNLIYTACSRSSNKLHILGDEATFIACAKRAMKIRKTSLNHFLKIASTNNNL